MGALARLNPNLPTDAYTQAIDELTRSRVAMSPPAANREIYMLLKNGIKVPYEITYPNCRVFSFGYETHRSHLYYIVSDHPDSL